MAEWQGVRMAHVSDEWMPFLASGVCQCWS